MPDSAQNARLKELTDLIEKERDHDKFAKLIDQARKLGRDRMPELRRAI